MENEEEDKLEDKVKKLREVIVEVQKNQSELSKVLQEKGVSSTSFIKLTDSKIFEEEQEALNKVVKKDILRKRSSSIESLQLKFEKLKQKCIIKNRIIVALLKSIECNGPKEWWEDLIECIFEELKPEEEINCKVIGEFISQTSKIIESEKKASESSEPIIEELLPNDVAQSPSKSVIKDSTSKSENNVTNGKKPITEMVSKKRDHLLKYFKTSPLENSNSGNAHQVSFIQKILFEDSQAGVAVVDLFVAVKKAKDKLENLSKMNDEASTKTNCLKNDSISFRSKYGRLIKCINEFLDRIKVLSKEDYIKKDSSLTEKTNKIEVSNALQTSEEELLRSKIKHYKTCQAIQESNKLLYDFVNKNNSELLEFLSCEKNLKIGTKLQENKNEEETKIISTCEKEATEDTILAAPLKNKKNDSNSDNEDNENNNDEDYDVGAVTQETSKYITEVVKAGNQELEKVSIKSLEEVEGTMLISSVKEKNNDSHGNSDNENDDDDDDDDDEDDDDGDDNDDDDDDDVKQEILRHVTENGETRSQESDNLSENYSCDTNNILRNSSLSDMDDLPSRADSNEKELLKVSYHDISKNLSSPNLSCTFKSVKSSKSLNSENIMDDLIDGDAESINSTVDAKKEDGKGNRDDTVSEGSSVFEEALSEWVTDIKTKSNTTLDNSTITADKTKKSASTLTADNDLMTSWISKLAEDLKSKIRTLKLDSNNQVFVDEKSTASIDNLEFKINASTPFGVFDIVIKEYKNNATGGQCEGDTSAGNPQLTSASDNEKISQANQIPVKVITENECYWSEDSLPNTDSDYLSQVGVTSAEDEMEEFMEVSVQKKQLNKLIGTLKRTMLKTEKVPFFEIQKCVPKNFFHEIFVKGQAPSTKVIGIANNEALEGSNHNNNNLINVTRSDNLIIYIQVDLDEKEEENPNANEIYIECKSSFEKLPEISIGQGEGVSEQEIEITSEKQFLTGENVSLEDEDQIEAISEHEIEVMNENEEIETASNMNVEDEGSQAENSETQTLEIRAENEVLKKKNSSTEFEETLCENKKICERLNSSNFYYSKMEALTFTQMHDTHRISRTDCQPKKSDLLLENNIKENVFELEGAIKLLHEIESNVVDVKLSDAILSLPELESELRKHMQKKTTATKIKGELCTDSSVEKYYSAVNFPAEKKDKGSSDPQRRLKNILLLLSDLEDAIKKNQINKNVQDNSKEVEENSSKIFKLLHILTKKIAELEVKTSLEKGLDRTSESESSLRFQDSFLKSPLMSCCKIQKKALSQESLVHVSLERARRKALEIAAKESRSIENRIEKDFGRIERLERENVEALKFVEAFIDKTTRRTAELNSLKAELQSVSATLENFYTKLVKLKQKDNDDSLQNPSTSSLNNQGMPLKNTVSGLLKALDHLKTKAREKNEACQKLLNSRSFDSFEVKKQVVDKLSRASRSSFTAKSPEALTCNITEIKQIGWNSIYLAWTKPKGNMAEQVVGYEIAVNGRLNQKVRNPKRMQAVLYSVDVTKKITIQLYGLFLNHPKVLLAVVRFCAT